MTRLWAALHLVTELWQCRRGWQRPVEPRRRQAPGREDWEWHAQTPRALGQHRANHFARATVQPALQRSLTPTLQRRKPTLREAESDLRSRSRARQPGPPHSSSRAGLLQATGRTATGTDTAGQPPGRRRKQGLFGHVSLMLRASYPPAAAGDVPVRLERSCSPTSE